MSTTRQMRLRPRLTTHPPTRGQRDLALRRSLGISAPSQVKHAPQRRTHVRAAAAWPIDGRRWPGRWLSIKGRLKSAQLPTSGGIRYVPPRGYSPSMALPRGSNRGYIDRFGNEWVRGPSRTQRPGLVERGPPSETRGDAWRSLAGPGGRCRRSHGSRCRHCDACSNRMLAATAATQLASPRFSATEVAGGPATYDDDGPTELRTRGVAVAWRSHSRPAAAVSPAGRGGASRRWPRSRRARRRGRWPRRPG